MKKLAACVSALVIAVLIAPSPALAAIFGPPDETPGIAPATIFGRIEVGAGVPATTCTVVLLGSPLGGICDDPSSMYSLPGAGLVVARGVPPGLWHLKISVPGFEPKTILAYVTEGGGHDFGTVVMGPSSTVRGRVIAAPGRNPQDYVVAFSQAGLYAPVDSRGTFQLTGVPAGEPRWISLIYNGGEVTGRSIGVSPGVLSDGIVFRDSSVLPPRPGPLPTR